MLPFLSNTKPIVGLDIGSGAIKAVELKPAGKQWRLHRFGMKPLAPEAVVNGQIKDMEGVTQAIRDLMAEKKFSTKRVATAVSGSAVIVKKIQLGIMPELELEDQISLEAEEYIPFDIEEVHLDFQILGNDGENMDVLLSACKKDAVNNRLEALETAGLHAAVCDLDLFCIANAYDQILKPQAPEEEETVALVNVGAALTNLTILHNSDPLFTRDLMFGSATLTKEIQQRYGLSSEEAERLKCVTAENSADNPTIPRDLQTEAITPFLEQLMRQVGQSLDFFKGTNPQQPINALLLSGGGGMTGGIVKLMTEHSGLQVRLVDPLLGLKAGRSARKSLEFQKMAPSFMVAVGLALRGAA
ncbi:MAG: type IV pilus assembly protein PilM [Magnetococcales bacterium]|nr:type IV pilus assembly protein PilM [Magnetococcales bacterium]